mmetsp:Transcript_32260/g.58983  ORF Transcript_32260/g.58983 Transcript_32260/m.58983 type:complete len:135 (+) Transcript_32260:88-492(+)
MFAFQLARGARMLPQASSQRLLSSVAASTRNRMPTVAGQAALDTIAPMGSSTLPQIRSFGHLSPVRRGHNLEDHYDYAEFICKMHNPLGEYLIWFFISTSFFFAIFPLLHTNYYFSGRFLPKDQSGSQLCDDSW